MQRIKARILEWLAPGLGAEVTRQRWLIEAIHDLHMTQLPYGEMELEMAFQNCRGDGGGAGEGGGNNPRQAGQPDRGL